MERWLPSASRCSLDLPHITAWTIPGRRRTHKYARPTIRVAGPNNRRKASDDGG